MKWIIGLSLISIALYLRKKWASVSNPLGTNLPDTEERRSMMVSYIEDQKWIQ
jgi:hypothetical protein